MTATAAPRRTATTSPLARKLMKFGAVALIALSVGFGLGSKAEVGPRPTRADVLQLAKAQAEAGNLSCWLEWNEEQQGHEVLCSNLTSPSAEAAGR